MSHETKNSEIPSKAAWEYSREELEQEFPDVTITDSVFTDFLATLENFTDRGRGARKFLLLNYCIQQAGTLLNDSEFIPRFESACLLFPTERARQYLPDSCHALHNECLLAGAQIISHSELDALALLNSVIENGGNVNSAPNTDSLLHSAIISGARRVVQRLIEAKADLKAIGADGFTPLSLAITEYKSDIDSDVDSGIDSDIIFSSLLSAGAAVNDHNTTDQSSTALHLAVELGKRTELIGRLLDAGANLEAKDADGETPLHAAVRHNLQEEAQLLLNKRADVNARNADGDTPLRLLDPTNINFVSLLLRHGADPNIADSVAGNTLLHDAARSGAIHTARLLLQHGADPLAVNHAGNTPTQLASSHAAALKRRSDNSPSSGKRPRPGDPDHDGRGGSPRLF